MFVASPQLCQLEAEAGEVQCLALVAQASGAAGLGGSDLQRSPVSSSQDPRGEDSRLLPHQGHSDFLFVSCSEGKACIPDGEAEGTPKALLEGAGITMSHRS